MKEFWLNVLASIVGSVIFVYLTTHCDSLLRDAGAVISLPVILLSAMLVLFGACIGWLAHGLITWRKNISYKRSSEKESWEAVRKAIMQLDESNKRLLKAVATKGEVYCSVDDWRLIHFYDSQFYAQFINLETVENGRLKLTATELLKKAYTNYHDYFSVISDESIQKRAVFDPERKKWGNFRYSQDILWWWYTDNPEIIEGGSSISKK